MKHPSPIPIPFKQRWIDFKTKYVPLLMFSVLCGSVIWMWGRYLNPSAVVGEVEAIRANVISTVPGTLLELNVTRMQRVTNGQCVAVIRVIDSDVSSNELAAIEADLTLLKNRMEIAETRNVTTLVENRRALLTEKLDLDLAKVRLTQAESELARMSTLHEDKLIPTGGNTVNTYEIALRDRDSAKSEVEQRTRLVEQTELDLRELQRAGQTNGSAIEASIQRTIEAQRRRIESVNRCIPLYAPMSGFVSAISNHCGERIMAGSPILVISAESSERVIGWVRQPVTVQPKVGDIVKVRRPLLGQKSILATIVQVGTQLEPVSVTALPVTASIIPGQNRGGEIGLPFLVELPKNAHFTPGEPVQLEIPKHPRTDI